MRVGKYKKHAGVRADEFRQQGLEPIGRRHAPTAGDPEKMARAMIDCAEQNPAPKRLASGSDAYSLMHAALTERLAALEAHKALACSIDL